MRHYGFLGIPSDIGGRHPGAALAPSALRARGVIEELGKVGAQVTDLGDSQISREPSSGEDSLRLPSLAPFQPPFSPGELRGNHYREVYQVCLGAKEKVSDALSRGFTPIIVGGDHSVSMGTVGAVSAYYHERGEKIGLIWIDAHPDLNTPESSTSGNLHGCSVAALTGIFNGAFSDLSALSPNVPGIAKENVAFIGLRDIDPPEREAIKSNNLRAWTMHEVDRYGMAQAIEGAIAVASANTAGFFVSFDLDVCDPSIAPGTGTVYPGGLTFREAHLVMELLYSSGKMLGGELVELAPSLDVGEVSTKLALSLLQAMVGEHPLR